MKQIQKLLLTLAMLVAIAFIGNSCQKFLGLKKQTDWNFTPVTLDPHIGMNAWDYLKQRANGTTANDTIFKRMYQGIIYSGIDTNEYTKPNRTFILLHNDAIYRLASNKITVDCYWGFYKTKAGKTGLSWSDYPQDSVKNWLLYLISEGNYNFETLKPVITEAPTLMPKGANPANPESIITYNINNASDYKLMINNYVGSSHPVTVRTAGIIATNGPIQVVDRLIDDTKQ